MAVLGVLILFACYTFFIYNMLESLPIRQEDYEFKYSRLKIDQSVDI